MKLLFQQKLLSFVLDFFNEKYINGNKKQRSETAQLFLSSHMIMIEVANDNSIEKAANLLNYACANRKQLLEKEVRIAPSLLKIIINRHDKEYFKNTDQLINSINRDDNQSTSNHLRIFSEDILQQQTKSYDSFKKSAATLRNFSSNFANYSNNTCE
jgi:hypothetical protein